MRHVDLPGPLDETGAADDEPALEHHARIDERSRVTRDEDEHVRGIAESVVALGNPVDRVVGDMVEKNRPVGEAAQQVETIITALRRQDSLDLHDVRSPSPADEAASSIMLALFSR